MKIRNGFVSNSSSTSFALVGQIIQPEEMDVWEDSVVVITVDSLGDENFVFAVPERFIEQTKKTFQELQDLSDNTTTVFRVYALAFEGLDDAVPTTLPEGCILMGGECSINGPRFRDYNFDLHEFVETKENDPIGEWLKFYKQ